MEGNLGHDVPLYPLGRRQSIEQRVAQSLRGLIVSGHLKEGTPLVQRELAARLGVSQTPIRAGLSQLEREGFVALGPTGRAVVNRLTREDFEEIYAARYGLEGLAARVGAEAVGADELALMREYLAALRDAAGAQDVDTYLGLRWDFHGTCYRASGRPRLVAEVERLYHRSERYNRIVLSTPRRFRESVGRYAAFLAACKARDGAAAERTVQESLSWAVERVAGSLPSESEQGA
jgi:DNA-binding GntR family transcriptional regulator